MPIPHGTRLPSRPRGQTAVLADSPYKRHLENASTSKRKSDRKGSCGATTKKRLGNVPNIREKWSGNMRVTGHISDEYEDETGGSCCIYCKEKDSETKGKAGWI